ncbi:uncharacterized protein LOC111380023 [Olea europaea var. sylvestris]|uniref:uncharacterized protein LOC111380023 n=1 Tax=Olea europaea var. sylvestris TaxID=158386 RepID=UPI000C1CDE75|nr:uncharacterized protein LOC111380023 [Olea europaea var. sylvestris]
MHAGQSSIPVSQCPKCNKFHQGECLYGKYLCYKCGQPSHMASSCPSIKKPKQEKKRKARVFALTHDEVAKNSDVIPAKINASCHKNDSVLEVSMPSSGTIDMDRIDKGVQIDFDGLTLEANLYVIEMKDFDIILGMDWLGENRAMIVCFEKEVIFRRPGEEEFRFCGSKIKALPRVISALKAESMLRKADCQEYLVSITSTSTQEKVLGNVPIVREYVYVFPEDLPGTPHDRQVKFTIDLISGAIPVSKSLYRMSPKELQELKM